MRKFLTIVLILFASQAWGATYYVDPDCTDTNVGSATVDGTEYNPATLSCTGGTEDYYVTIADVNAKSFTAGDFVYFKKGKTWREQLTIPSDGSAGSPITFGAYGTGTAPIISGSNLITGFDPPSSWTSVFTATITDSTGNGTNDQNIRNKFPANFLSGSGTTIRVSVKANPGFALQVDGMAIGAASGTMDFASTPARITFGGENTLSAAANSETTSDAITFTLDNTVANIISIGLIDGFYYSYAAPTGPVSYYKNGTTDSDESQTVDVVDGGYSDSANMVRLVSKIEVLTAGEPGTVWEVPLATQPYVVTFDNVMGIHADNVADVNAEYHWYWASNVLYVYSATDPDTAYTAPGIEAGTRLACIRTDSRSYATVRDIQAWGGNAYAVYGEGHNNVTIDNVIIKNIGGSGIQYDSTGTNASIINSNFQYIMGLNPGAGGDGIWNGASGALIDNNTITFSGAIGADGDPIQNADADNVTISNNTIDESASTGSTKYCIITSGGDNVLIEHNTGNGCSNSGMMIGDTGPVGTVVRYNTLSNIQGAGRGIELAGSNTADNVSIYYNVVYGCEWGIVFWGVLDVTNIKIYNNTVYCAHRPLSLEGATTGFSGNIKNNIFWASDPNRVASVYNSLVVDPGVTMNNNIIGPEGTDFMDQYDGTMYSTLAAWVAATPYDDNSSASDPLFVSTATPDLHLRAGSPAINEGTSVSLTQDYDGYTVPRGAAPDIGAYEWADTPLLISPAQNAAGLGFPIVFIWEGFHGAVSYEMQVDDNSDFSSPEMDIFTDDTTVEGDDTDGLKLGTHYYWRVRAVR